MMALQIIHAHKITFSLVHLLPIGTQIRNVCVFQLCGQTCWDMRSTNHQL
ncbi:hypothetical protein Leryth_025352 [Lithospermum erythrorhizon]|nr:hypothetical protein Leryth_025352 [Lithospermum erythrorhizon]